MRRFESADDQPGQFWEIEQEGTQHAVRRGRTGTTGGGQIRNVAHAGAAGAAMLLIEDKTGQGYVEPGALTPTAPTPDTEAPAQSLDQQVERCLLSMLAHIADGTIAPRATGFTSRAIQRAHGIGAMAADEVRNQLQGAGLLWAWRSTISDEAPQIAIDLLTRRVALAPGAESDLSVSACTPWLAHGEALYLDDALGSTRRLARATRRHPQPVEAVEPQWAWEQVRTRIGDSLEADFPASDPRLRSDFEAAWHSLTDERLSGSAVTDAMLMAMSLNILVEGRPPVDVGFIDYLVARHGLAYAIDALLGSLALDMVGEYSTGRHRIQCAVFSASTADMYHYVPMSDGHWRLRTHLAAAPQDVYDACAARIIAAMPELGPYRRITLALLLPDMPAISNALIAQLCSGAAAPPACLQWLQINASDPAALALARKVRPDKYACFFDRPDMVSTVLLEHGTDAVRWLAPGAGHAAAGEALTRIGTPEAVEALARAAGSARPALARLQVAAQRWPIAAMAALARTLNANGSNQHLLMPTLLGLVRDHPSRPDELRPWLPPSANAVLDGVRARLAGPALFADDSALPEALASRPSPQARTASDPALQLDALPLAAVERWDDGEQAASLAIDYWDEKRATEIEDSPDAITKVLDFHIYIETPERAAARAAIAQGQVPALLDAWRSMRTSRAVEDLATRPLDGVMIAHLPAALGVPLWNSIAGEARILRPAYLAAAWGLRAFPGMLAPIRSAPAEHLAIALHFGIVELGPIVAHAFARDKARRGTGREWLERFPEHAACALIAPALGAQGEQRACAASALRYLNSIGHTALLEQVAARYRRPDVLPALHAMLNEQVLVRALHRRLALPAFWKPGHWRRPLLQNGKALPDAAIDALGTLMAWPTAEDVHASLLQIRQACTAQSLADFAWDCFAAWLNAGAPPGQGWALHRLGIFGNDGTARDLTTLIRAWPGAGAHARAVAGLDVLATIGSDVALMLLNGIAQKVGSRSLQDKAAEKISRVAKARGLSQDDLQDRLVPDLGLDAHGSLVLDFGPRAFQVGFDEALQPHVRTWADGRAGSRLPDLPRPTQSDDAARAAEATARFKRLKQDVRTIASQQVDRLEVAMCTRRRWSGGVFVRYIAAHPLVRHLAHRLVWGVYAVHSEASDGGELQACFRVSNDGQYTNAADDPFTLPEGEQYRIGLPHALELSAQQASAFGELLAAYELLQPFAQLGRDTHTLTDQERDAEKLARWNGLTIATGKILGLVNMGWRRGAPREGGAIMTFDKAIGSGRCLELTVDPGIIAGLVNDFPEQTLGDVAVREASRRRSTDEFDTVGTLDPITASELIRDMERLCS